MRTRGQVAGVVVVVGLVAAGCGNIAERAAEEVVERAAENAGGGDVDVDFDDGEFDVEGDDFSMDSEIGGLPDGWPDEIPLPDELTIEAGFATEVEGELGYSASGTFDGDCDPDFLAFLNGLPASWTPLENFPAPDCTNTLVQAMYLDGTWQVAYSLISDGDERQFSVLVGPDQTE